MSTGATQRRRRLSRTARCTRLFVLRSGVLGELGHLRLYVGAFEGDVSRPALSPMIASRADLGRTCRVSAESEAGLAGGSRPSSDVPVYGMRNRKIVTQIEQQLVAGPGPGRRRA